MVTKKTTKKPAKARSQKPKAKVAHASGKRKRAIARATIREGNSRVRVNDKSMSNLQPEIARERIMEPLHIAGKLAQGLSIKVNVKGGGWSSQAEAARLAISKALVAYTGSEELKKDFLEYDRHLLVADTRRKEARKPGTHSKARAKRQKSKR